MPDAGVRRGPGGPPDGIVVMRVVGGILACALISLAQPSNEEASLRRDAVQNPQKFGPNRKLAQFYLNQNKVAKALPWLEKAQRAEPSNYENSYDLALARLTTKDVGGSRSLVEALIAKQDRSELHNLMGDIEEASGNFDAAARQYETAARMDPSEKNLFDLGTDLLRHRATEQALVVFRYAAPLFPSSPRIQIGLGIALYSAGQYPEAVEALCRAVDLDPNDTKALGFLGGMYDVAPEMIDEVTRRLAHFVEVYPNNASANYYYGLSLWRRVSGPNAATSDPRIEKYLKRAIALDDKLAGAHFQLGVLYSDQHKITEAIREFEQAIKYEPDNSKYHYRLGQAYQSAGRNDEAREQFQRYRQLHGNKGEP
jgi:tetratricopeptide (TPR) repeat protein